MTVVRRVPISLRVAIIIAVVTIVVFFVFSNANNRHENAILQNQAFQAATIEQSTLSNVLSVLNTLATTTTISNGSTQAFQTEAQNLVHSPVSVALAKAYLSEYVVFAGVGNAFKVGQALNEGVFETFHPTGVSVVTGPVVSAGDQSTATFAVGPPLVPNGNAIFLQFTVNPYVASILPAGPTLSDLRVALYGSLNPARANLVVATSSDALPWPGPVVSVPFTVGSGTWTLTADARSSLIGGFAEVGPLIILILGLLLALSMGFAVEVLVRQRRSAQTAPEIQARIEPESREGVPVPQEVAKEIDQEPLTVAPDRRESSVAPVASSAQEYGDPVPTTATSLYADWRPDPFGRSELRRFFLGSPTSLVRDGTAEHYDPVSSTLEQAEVGSVAQPPVLGRTDVALPNEDEIIPGAQANESESVALANASDDARPTAEVEQALEFMAARIAGTIAEEIDELLAVPSGLDEHAPAPPAPPVAPAAPTPPPPPKPPMAPTVSPPAPPVPPVAPAAPTPPPPPKPPTASVVPSPTRPVISETDASGSKEANDKDGGRTIGTPPKQEQDDPLTAFGAVSMLWRRLRGVTRRP